MKKGYLLKALVIIIPVVLAVLAQFSEQKQQKQILENYKTDCFVELTLPN